MYPVRGETSSDAMGFFNISIQHLFPGLRICAFAMAVALSLFVPDIAVASASCQTAPQGMVCIPAGTTTRGNDKGAPNQRPAASVQVATFYLDKTEVSNRAYNECLRAKACFRRFEMKVPSFLLQPDQPVTYVSWYDASRYCRWRGKRLPTEAEWERAARGEANTPFAWGQSKPSCKHAHYSGCSPRRPRPARSGKAHHFGLKNMAGNVMEWVHDWYAPCYEGCKEACGATCQGNSPKGPCHGKSDCPLRRHKVLKGGSWRHGANALHAAWRKRGIPSHWGPYIGFRCASSTPQLKPPGPPLHLQSRPAPPAPTGPLPEAQRQIFLQTPVDDLQEKKRCPHPGRSTSKCRDPLHYVKSNEKHQHLWRPYIRHLGGAYIGIGADQNYTFIAWSRANVAWLMDYDIVIYWLHKLHRALILNAPTGRDFLRFWEEKQAKQTIALVRRVYADDPERNDILRIYQWYQRRLLRYFRYEYNHKQKAQRQHWLPTPRHYQYIRLLYQQGRIRPMPGDLLKFKSLRGAVLAARKMGVTVRTLYFSNAEEFWYYPAFFRESIRLVPLDAQSIVIRSLSSYQWFSKKSSYFHYNVQHALHYQRALNERDPRSKHGFRHPNVYDLMVRFRTGTSFPNLTTIRLPSVRQ